MLHFTLNFLATRETVDIEDLVDDFATFYIAGESLEDKRGYSLRVLSILGSSPHLLSPPKRKIITSFHINFTYSVRRCQNLSQKLMAQSKGMLLDPPPPPTPQRATYTAYPSNFVLY